MIFSVADNDASVGRESQALDALHLTLHRTPTHEARVVSAVRTEYLDSVVAGVADENESLAVEQNSTRIFELTVESAFSTDRLLVLSRRREDLYPMIARVGDDYFISVIGDGDVVWILEATVVAPEPSK